MAPRGAGARLRAVLHHQGAGPRHRPRPVDGLRHRQADRRLHLGRLRASAQGTCIRIYLPRDMAAPVPARASAGGRAPASARGSETLLVVEDEEGVRELMQAWLRSARLPRADRRQRRRGARGRARRYDGRIDLVVADMVMPAMGGPALVQQLEAGAARPQGDVHVGLRRRLARRSRRARRADAVPAEAVRARARWCTRSAKSLDQPPVVA